MWGTPAPAPPAPPAAPPASVSANNALFLVVFGMFLTMAVLPVLVASLLRLAVLVVAVLLAAAATNPSDQSFAFWVNSQDLSERVPDASAGVSQWFSAMYKTAKALVCNEELTWRFHNVLFFSVVFVPSLERYAFGCFGTWRWADGSNETVAALCRAPWVVKFSRGGVMSSIERYMMRSTTGSTPADRASLRRRHVESSRSTGMASGFQSDESAAVSDRTVRAKAMQCKVRKDWKQAAQFFLEAAQLAGSTLARGNYELEAAFCALEDATVGSSKATSPDSQRALIAKVQSVCEELSSSGYFDEAARGLAELSMRLKRRFPLECKKPPFADRLAQLYVQAKNISEAGGSVHNAAEHGLRAARVYADAWMWPEAEGCFEAAGDIQRVDGQLEMANEAYGNAVLCRLGQTDMAGAEMMLNRFAEQMGEQHCASDMDLFLSSLLKACSKWSPQILETACKRYDSTHRLAPWQCQCLANLQEKLNNSDLR